MISCTVRASARWVAPILAIGMFAVLSPATFAKELKLGHFLPPRHTNHTKVMQPWASEVAKRSGGDLKIQIYPARQLGGTPAGQYNQALRGIADISFMVPGYTPTVFPGTGIVELPFLTKDAQHATRILWAVFPKYLSKEYNEVKVITFWTVDNFVIQSRKPIRSLDDLKGLKIRSPSSTVSAIAKIWGAVPVNMPITKVYTSLERGVINGFFAGPSAMFSFKLGEVVKFYTTGVGGSNLPLFIVMNKKSWNALSGAHKKIIEQTSGPSLGLKGAAAYDARYKRAIATARKKSGVEVIDLSAAEQAKFRAAAAPMIENWIAAREKQGIDARAMYELAKTVE